MITKHTLLNSIPKSYNPYFHMIFPSTFASLVFISIILLLNPITWLQLLTIPISLFLLLGFEWLVHSKWMHFPNFPRFLFERHMDHHILYDDKSMSITFLKELHFVLMPAIAIVLAFLIAIVPAILLSLWIFNVGLLWLGTAMFYFTLYEMLHLSYHLPEGHWLGRNVLIKKLKKLHQNHHNRKNMSKYNFNVTFPVFDWILRTKK